MIAKLQGTAHLASGSVFLAVTGLLVLTPLLSPCQSYSEAFGRWVFPAALGLQYTLLVVSVFYLTSCMRRDGLWGIGRFARDFIPFLALSTGLALHNALAVIEGWSGRESAFVRTPKRGEVDAEGKLYLAGPVGWIVFAELALCGWGLAGFFWALAHGEIILAGFLATQAAGCGAVAFGSARDRLARGQA